MTRWWSLSFFPSGWMNVQLNPPLCWLSSFFWNRSNFLVFVKSWNLASGFKIWQKLIESRMLLLQPDAIITTILILKVLESIVYVEHPKSSVKISWHIKWFQYSCLTKQAGCIAATAPIREVLVCWQLKLALWLWPLVRRKTILNPSNLWWETCQ